MNVQQRVAADRVDITTLATMQGALTSITDEMSQVVIRTARSPVFKLAKDFSCTLCDWQSRQMIQGDAELPVHVGSIPFVCRAVAEAYQGNIAPGDTFLCNDPAFGGLHLNDVALLRPIFVDDELLFWAVIRAHWLDIGGPSPADLRRAQSDSYGEGIRIPPLKVIAAGVPCDDVMRLYFNNIRFPQQQHSDMLAMIAAGEIAGRRLRAMAEKYGVEVTKAGIEALYEMTEHRVRTAITDLPDGISEGESWLSAREGDGHMKISATVEVSGDEMSIKLSSPEQLREVRNSPFGATHAAVGHAVTIALGLKPPFNDGLYRALDIDYGPLGTITNAQVPPAPTLGCTTQPFCEIVDSVRHALSKIIDDERQTAGWGPAASIVLAGIHPETGQFYGHFHPNGGSSGGGGAAHGADGWSGVGSENSGGAVLKEPVELLEYEMPFLVSRLEYRMDSGGAGRWRGGLAVDTEWEPLDHEQTARFHGTIDTFPALGVQGAKSTMLEPKLGQRNAIDPDGGVRKSGGASRLHSQRGGRLEMCPPGGGGVGDAFARDIDAVRSDVVNGYVSIEGAALDYGVVVDPDELTVDQDATDGLRNK
ncbi:MAG: hydantoinase B/oxoprolinase family protein [Rhodospirillaceae bacterium]|jgi:N-methylhydantoinase B|nr:hydantoinase B/oxoprolinase family protein [Rhodospirillaceae bacterium]MBT5192030.1 hydantoinase B/oxoprolinase family protein [Rhodospirillaceae bacterium]MBT5897320.1 hydantoinase B/oxoprolinase family protein [Rhodospirillaceae bacterium]MBT6427444.1 hydantoinase B/oxoprolinase family protein [Rhodospirillaceae bacterium]